MRLGSLSPEVRLGRGRYRKHDFIPSVPIPKPTSIGSHVTCCLSGMGVVRGRARAGCVPSFCSPFSPQTWQKDNQYICWEWGRKTAILLSLPCPITPTPHLIISHQLAASPCCSAAPCLFGWGGDKEQDGQIAISNVVSMCGWEKRKAPFFHPWIKEHMTHGQIGNFPSSPYMDEKPLLCGQILAMRQCNCLY